MSAAEIVKELKALGKESYKRVLMNHCIQEPVFGVSIEALKKIQKRIKKDYQLALDLYDTGIYDAMYLAGLIADEMQMTKKDLQRWIDTTKHTPLCGFTVAWVAAESRYGWEIAQKWIESKSENVATAGWATLSSVVAITDDRKLDLPKLKELLKRVEKTIHQAPNDVRYVMNGFVIALGTYVQPLSELALKTAEKIGAVTVNLGNTACKVPYAPDYIRKVQKRGTIGKKRKSAKC
jgi:Predicted DNA alkylation repair enzyme